MTDLVLWFAIPTGLGIPMGVLRGQERGYTMAALAGLYMLASIGRACLFEVLFRRMIATPPGPRRTAIEQAVTRILSDNPWLSRALRGPFAPLIIGYNLDPMAGRVAAAAVGMGWIAGWGWSLLADLAYFITTAYPTIWIQQLVGGTKTTVAIVLGFMLVVPWLWRRWRV